ncbi:unnamed protein product [Didymodactylos carnosus]|uniref:Arginase n=1 Tax=Didymodactylos carnosus TaxID=1234261 RepID=A0A815G9E2_9BILA|nr:unnamed protein product [Didymodactylos carnosus]CAF1336314.1 unnamed protein product [Didymodactylos carnosus]CAF3869110.1 unnamed protein product [Didymodactylos carnosus]CAF4193778.1 unnamed protein product [Didymodactylos carnosus]
MVKNFGIVQYACKLGQDEKGVENTPDILSNILLPYIKENEYTVHLYNSAIIRKLDDCSASGNENAIFTANLQLRSMVKKSLDENNKTLIIGGDHTMGLGTVSGFLEKYPQQSFVIWIDAHPDLNTRQSSESGHYHGMSMSFMLGLDADKNFPVNQKLRFDQLLYIGLRDVDDFEKKVLKENKVKCLYGSIRDKDINEILSKTVGKGKNVHISWDVDSIDPSAIPSTGTPVERGMDCSEVIDIIRAVSKENRLVSMDVTELNLDLGLEDDQKKSLKNSIDVVKHYITC